MRSKLSLSIFYLRESEKRNKWPLAIHCLSVLICRIFRYNFALKVLRIGIAAAAARIAPDRDLLRGVGCNRNLDTPTGTRYRNAQK